MMRSEPNICYIATVKGNLATRIEKLGLDVEEKQRTQAQKDLHSIALAQGWRDVHNSTVTGAPHPERPLWAGGAFVYCHRLHADALKRLLKYGPLSDDIGELKSKHIICSLDTWPILEEALKSESNDALITRRQAFLNRRAGVVESVHEIALPVYITLDDVVWNASGVLNADIMEYVTAPGSVQTLDDGVWNTIYEGLADYLPHLVQALQDEQTNRVAPCCASCETPLWFHHWKSPSCFHLATCSEEGWSLLLKKILDAIQKI